MILDTLVNGEVKLSKSEKWIALSVLNNPTKVINQSITSLAKEAGVSLPTVNRFCKKLGFDGYPAFKIQIAQEITNTNELLDRFNVDKDTPEVVKRVMSDIQSTIVNVGQNLNPESIDKATDLLANAKSITFFGLGGSGPVALDAQHKFFRFGVPVVAHTDYINQRMIVSMMKEGDLLVSISFTSTPAAKCCFTALMFPTSAALCIDSTGDCIRYTHPTSTTTAIIVSRRGFMLREALYLSIGLLCKFRKHLHRFL